MSDGDDESRVALGSEVFDDGRALGPVRGFGEDGFPDECSGCGTSREDIYCWIED